MNSSDLDLMAAALNFAHWNKEMFQKFYEKQEQIVDAERLDSLRQDVNQLTHEALDKEYTEKSEMDRKNKMTTWLDKEFKKFTYVKIQTITTEWEIHAKSKEEAEKILKATNAWPGASNWVGVRLVSKDDKTQILEQVCNEEL